MLLGHTTSNQALRNAYIWLQYGYFGCNWNQLHRSLVVDRWLQLERCNSLRQPLRCGVATDCAIAMNKKGYCNQYLVARTNIAMNKKA